MSSWAGPLMPVASISCVRTTYAGSCSPFRERIWRRRFGGYKDMGMDEGWDKMGDGKSSRQGNLSAGDQERFGKYKRLGAQQGFPLANPTVSPCQGPQ